MKRKFVASLELEPQLKCEEAVEVEYYISRDEKEDEDFDGDMPFGIEVVKKQTIDGRIYKEIKTVRHLTDTMEKAQGLLAILHRNSVTPITAGEVLEDLTVKR